LATTIVIKPCPSIGRICALGAQHLRRFVEIVLAIALLSGMAHALTTAPPGPDQTTPLVMCYWKNAVIIGRTKVCHPPPMLVGAVHGACDKEEQDVRNKAGNPRAADIAIRYLHQWMDTRIEGWILDAQDDNPACRSK
jgi:hypothetical protein